MEELKYDEIDLRRFAQVLWHWAWLIVLCGLLAGGAAFVVSRLQTPIYQATTTLLINQAPSAQSSDYTAVLTADRLAATYVQMLTTRPVLEETLSRLELTTPIDEFEKAINASLLTNTQLIELKAEDPNPARAADIANTLATVFSEQNDARQAERYAASKTNLQNQLDTLQADIASRQARLAALGSPSSASGQAEVDRLTTEVTQMRGSYATLLKSYEDLRLAEAQSASNLIQVAPATPPTDPVRPRTLLNTLLAAIVGGMLAVGGVFVIEYLDDSVKSKDDVTHRLGLPVIGTLVKFPENGGEVPYVALHPRSPVAESFRALRSNISFAAVDKPIHRLMVTSPGPRVGKSTVAVNLAVAFAQSGRRVALLDADLRRPRLHHNLGLSNQQGLSDLFVSDSLNLDGRLQATAYDHLWALTSGKLPPNPAELLASERMAAILDLLGEEVDLIVVDAPPAVVVTDPVVLGPRMDGILMVLEPGKTKLAAAQQALEEFQRSGSRVIGVVFNNVPQRRAGYYGAYQYQYRYSKGDGENQD
jgi:succinoglycan biosynthesis transport protein ExoP